MAEPNKAMQDQEMSVIIAQIPDSIIDYLKRLIQAEKDWNNRVLIARQTDLKFNGGGRYVYESCAEREGHGEPAYFHAFRKLAIGHGIDGDAVLDYLGYEQAIRLTDRERNWAKLPF